MYKIKALLAPLALIFAAIAIFEFGARYGASNTRAAALTGQMNNFLNLYEQVKVHGDDRSKTNLEAVIDNHIMTTVLVRDAWYLRLKDEPKASLEEALTSALSIRGDAVNARLETIPDSTVEGAPSINPQRLAEIRAALERAQSELTEAEDQE